MIEHAWWWPVARVEDLGPQPVPVRLLGQSLVLWRSEAGTVSLFNDRCPHRGARLSMGCVRGESLQCPYHGWRFDGQGHCVGIPAQPGFIPPASSAVGRNAVREAHGLWWAGLGSPTHEPPDLQHLPGRRLMYGPFDVATSAPRAVENFLDTAHFAYVHEGWLGDAQHPEVPPYEVEHTPDGRPLIPRYRAWQPRASASAQGGAWVEYRYEVLSPYAALLTKRGESNASAGNPQDSYVIWACPQTEGSCRLWFAQYTTDESTPEAELRDFQIAIFAQDQPILESQEPKALPLSGGEAMSAADRLSAAYRRYLKDGGIGFGVC